MRWLRSDNLNCTRWEFGWAVLEPINIARGDENEKDFATRFSPGQKHFTTFGT